MIISEALCFVSHCLCKRFDRCVLSLSSPSLRHPHGFVLPGDSQTVTDCSILTVQATYQAKGQQPAQEGSAQAAPLCQGRRCNPRCEGTSCESMLRCFCCDADCSLQL